MSAIRYRTCAALLARALNVADPSRLELRRHSQACPAKPAAATRNGKASRNAKDASRLASQVHSSASVCMIPSDRDSTADWAIIGAWKRLRIRVTRTE